jgi:hypothetical protein
MEIYRLHVAILRSDVVAHYRHAAEAWDILRKIVDTFSVDTPAIDVVGIETLVADRTIDGHWHLMPDAERKVGLWELADGTLVPCGQLHRVANHARGRRNLGGGVPPCVRGTPGLLRLRCCLVWS